MFWNVPKIWYELKVKVMDKYMKYIKELMRNMKTEAITQSIQKKL